MTSKVLERFREDDTLMMANICVSEWTMYMPRAGYGHNEWNDFDSIPSQRYCIERSIHQHINFQPRGAHIQCKTLQLPDHFEYEWNAAPLSGLRKLNLDVCDCLFIVSMDRIVVNHITVHREEDVPIRSWLSSHREHWPRRPSRPELAEKIWLQDPGAQVTFCTGFCRAFCRWS